MKYSEKLALRYKRVYVNEMSKYLNGKKINYIKLKCSHLYLEKFAPELLDKAREIVAEKVNKKFVDFINSLDEIRP